MIAISEDLNIMSVALSVANIILGSIMAYTTGAPINPGSVVWRASVIKH